MVISGYPAHLRCSTPLWGCDICCPIFTWEWRLCTYGWARTSEQLQFWSVYYNVLIIVKRVENNCFVLDFSLFFGILILVSTSAWYFINTFNLKFFVIFQRTMSGTWSSPCAAFIANATTLHVCMCRACEREFACVHDCWYRRERQEWQRAPFPRSCPRRAKPITMQIRTDGV